MSSLHHPRPALLPGAIVLSLLSLSCSDEPTEATQTDNWIAVSQSYAEIRVDDSLEVRVQMRNGAGDPQPFDAQFESGDGSVVTVTVIDSTTTDAIPETAVMLHALDFGQTYIDIEIEQIHQRILVQTLPGTIEITGLPEPMASGQTVQLSGRAVGLAGTPMSINLALEWSSGNSGIFQIDSTGFLRAGLAGTTTVFARTIGSTEGIDTVVVVPSLFAGTLSSDTLDVLDTLVLKRGNGLSWGAADQINFLGSHWFRNLEWNLDSASFLVAGPLGKAGIEILRWSLPYLEEVDTIFVRSEPTPNTPATAPDLSAGPFPIKFFTWLTPAQPDDYYKFEPQTDLNLDILMDWEPSGDIDFWAEDCLTQTRIPGTDAATGSNPERSRFTVPAGECWLLRINDFDGSSVAPQLTISTF